MEDLKGFYVLKHWNDRFSFPQNKWSHPSSVLAKSVGSHQNGGMTGSIIQYAQVLKEAV